MRNKWRDLTAALMLWISGQELAKPKRQNNKLSRAIYGPVSKKLQRAVDYLD